MHRDLSNRLKVAREAKDYTQIKVAKITNITNTTLSNYENGTSRPDPDTLKLLAKTYEVSTDYLLGVTDIPNHLKMPEPHPQQDQFLVAFSVKVKNLTEEQKEDVLKFVEFLKSKNDKK